MITIQQAGTQILGNNPKPLYFMCGSEYAIKQQYINHLKGIYKSYQLVDDLQDLFRSFSKKSLISPASCLYVSRYDSLFIKSIDKDKSDKLTSKIPASCCIVCVYEDEKAFSKLNKCFPDNTVRVDNVDSKYIKKYLKRDYPKLDERYIDLVCDNCEFGYGRAKAACGQLNCIRDFLHSIDDQALLYMLDLSKSNTEQQMMEAAAARSFAGVMHVVDNFEGDVSILLNGMCHVAIELDKALTKKSIDTFAQKYTSNWSVEDVYNFFDQAYTQTLKLRSSIGGNPYNSLVYLASLLKFSKIPSVKQVI